ncbi:hypothetical protein AMECASPLE_023893 [Ameca splendens]|uniref:Uncharacterized protein n=1 Tax=Ameca splendens TaxID=208324 RepID=A0ABV0YFW4_9TELE
MGPADSHLGQSRSSHGSKNPRPRGTSPLQQRPDRASRPRPPQAATGSEPAHTKAPRPGHREPTILQRAMTPATGRECGREEIDREPKLIKDKEQPKTQPDTNSQVTVTPTYPT